MIIDRRPFWLIGGAAGLLILAYFVFFTPKMTPDLRVQEQLTLLAQEPWTRVQIDQVQFIGPQQQPEQVVVHARRVADASPVRVHFVANSPYTAPSAMRRLTEQPLEGRFADLLMLPRSLTYEPYRDQFQAQATHAGVALFAGFPSAETAARRSSSAPVPAAQGSGASQASSDS